MTGDAALQDQIAAGARTIVHLHEHMRGLRQQATELVERFALSNRQYLTPSEDERACRLLISYWHARNALLQAVADFRANDADANGEGGMVAARQRDQVFLVGFAAAVVLVDAGRFLREIGGPHRAIVKKLNEPEPQFGIPAGAYNLVQQNLTSPVNAWRLYHANRHFERRREELSKCAAGDAVLAGVFALADELAERVRVSKRRYAHARLRVTAAQVSRAVTDHAFGKAASWAIEMSSRAISQIGMRPGHRPALPKNIRAALEPLLEPGDVIITRKQYAATNYFLPGYWPHAILYLGDCDTLKSLRLDVHENVQPRWRRLLELDAEDPRRVLEALADGVRLRSIRSAFGVDAVAVIRPQLTLPQRAEAIGRGLFHEGKPYDFDFDFTRSQRLVCTEVVYRSYEGIGGLEFPLTQRVGRLTLAAEDLLHMALEGKGFHTVAAYRPGEAMLALGPSAEKLLRKSLGAGKLSASSENHPS